MFEQLRDAVAASHGDGGGPDAMLDAYDDDLDQLLQVDPDTLGRDELVAFVARLETHKRRVAVLDHQLVSSLESRGVARELGCPSTATLLTHLLRINPGQARARVTAAGLLGPRRGLLGQPLPAVFERVAAAQATGAISAEHARVITATVTRLPDAVRDVHGDTAETDLIDFAHDFGPTQLAVLGRHLDVVLNPDGTLTDDADNKRRRDLTLAQHPDGSGALRGRLDPETVAALHAVLDSTARPLPAEDGTPDPRTPGQRRHDGLRDALFLALRCGQLPDVGGTPVTLVITLTTDQITNHLTTYSDGHGDCDSDGDPADNDGDSRNGSERDGECENYRDREYDNECGSDCDGDSTLADRDGDRHGSDTNDNDSDPTDRNPANSDSHREPPNSDNERTSDNDPAAQGDRATYGSTADAATHTTSPHCDSRTEDTDHDEAGENTTRARRRHRYDGGYARTNHGGLIPVADALALADQAEIITVLFDNLGGVLAYGRDKRNADAPMRRVLATRDRGCSFPNCTAPPAWCQPHHVIEWAQGGKTDIRNLTLLCGFHHREYKRLRWVCHMRDGLPYWTPPHWLDKTQTPRLNKAHL